jgi:CRISPR/Cas system CSM-associated protein Csm2 small subunit
MPDIRDAMGRAGFQDRQPEGGRGSGPRNVFGPGYPEYLTKDGHTRVDLITKEAEAVAARFESDRLKRHQLRSFYDHAKRQLRRLEYGAAFGEVHAEIARLKAFAADRAARSDNAVPPSFKRFIDLNVDAAKDEVLFRKGFMPHFEAVVAYYAHVKE